MNRRQTSVPRQWLITDERLGADLLAIINRLPRGSGVLVRHRGLAHAERAKLLRRIRRLALVRDLHVADEADGRVVRVHNPREICRASLGRAETLLLSPLHATRSHPGSQPLPRMRASAMSRLAPLPVLALGGMDERRFRRIQLQGFAGWAAIDAWLKVSNVTR